MKQVISMTPKNTVNLIDVDIWKIHVFKKEHSIYKLVYLKNELFICGFVDITSSSASKPLFISGSFKDSIQMALDSGMEVFELEGFEELLTMISSILHDI